MGSWASETAHSLDVMGCICLNRPAKLLCLSSLLTLWSDPGGFEREVDIYFAQPRLTSIVMRSICPPSKLEGKIGLLHRCSNCSTDLKLNVYIEKKICRAAGHLERATQESVNSFHPKEDSHYLHFFSWVKTRVPRRCEMRWKSVILHSEDADGVLF